VPLGLETIFRHINTRTVFVLAVALGTAASSAADAKDGAQPLILEHADSTEIISEGSVATYHLFGDVRFRQGETTIDADMATWNPGSGEVEFLGHVRVRRPGSVVSAEQLIYHRDQRWVTALDNVLVEDTTERFSLHSQRGHFDRVQDIAIADSLPILYWDFTLDSSRQTIVIADTIKYFRSESRGVGIGNVSVNKGDWRAHGQYGVVWPDSARAVLWGKPNAMGLGGEISGDTLTLLYASGSVDRVIAVGNASGQYSDTSTGLAGVSLLKGERADFFLTRDTLRAIRVIGQAYTDHIPGDSTQGANHASGDSLWLRFAAGRLQTMTVEGGARGVYVPDQGKGRDTVHYEGARITFHPDSSRIDLEAEAQLVYGTVVLNAGHITYWADRKDLLARPRIEADSAQQRTEGPRLADGSQVVTGDMLTYNMDTERGRIRGSRTELEDGFYRGGDFRKFTDSVFFVSDGIYTTCDREESHFQFDGREMVVVRDDKVIARPVVMRVYRIPVAILPFYIFPIRKGRHSGFLPLRFGNFERGERFIGNVGYYWAASDYWDAEGALDFNEETGLRLRGVVNYALRYRFHGNVSGSYARESRQSEFTETRTTRWSLQGSHQQTLSPSATLSATANFLSDNSYYQDYSYDPTDRRNRSLRSQVNLRKRFGGASLTAYAEVTENLDTDSRRLRLPQASLSFYERRILSPDSGADNRWYHNAYIGLNTTLTHTESKDPTVGDTTGMFDEKDYATVTYDASLRFPQKLLQHITVSPNASFSEAWYYVFNTNLARDAGVPIEEPSRRASGSLGVGTSANLYGFLNPHLFGLSTVRHTLSPRVGYTFTPAVTRHDDLRAFTGAGGGSSAQSQSVSFSLGNVFDAKLGEGDSAQKVSLFSASFSTRYDFERDTRRWGNLAGNARTTLARRLELAADALWDLYDPETLELQWSRPRLTNLGLSAGMTLKGDASALSSVTQLGTGDSYLDSTQVGEGIPINASFSYRYSESHGSGPTFKTHWLGWRVDLKPATNWGLNYQQTYDFVRHTVTDMTFELQRDLHCWQAMFVWIPGGSRSGYYFKLSVKDIPDIKIERSESGLLSGFGR